MNNRKLTVMTFLGLCAVCLAMGLVGLTFLHHKVQHSNLRTALENNTEYGERFAASIDSLLESGMTVAQVIGVYQLSFDATPSDGNRYICLISGEGRILCHPDREALGMDASGLNLLTIPDRKAINYAEWVSAGMFEGLLTRDGLAEELVRRIPLEKDPINVMVHTNLGMIGRESNAIFNAILMVLLPACLVFVIIATLVVRLLGRRYEAAIELNNRNLEERVEERTAELKQAKNALLLNEKLALLGQLVAGIAHEINNPLSSIRLHAERLEEDAATAEDRDAARTITRSVERCSLLVRNLLSFARNAPPQIAPVDINDVVDTALAFCGHELKRAGVSMEKRLALESPRIPADAIQLEQVVLNLVTNAAQALSGRHGERRVRVTSELLYSTVVIRVEDSGPGLDGTIVETLFEPFHTTKESGTGLGLSLCRRFVERHGGTITHSKSDDLGGAAFLVQLPRVRPGGLQEVPASSTMGYIG